MAHRRDTPPANEFDQFDQKEFFRILCVLEQHTLEMDTATISHGSPGADVCQKGSNCGGRLASIGHEIVHHTLPLVQLAEQSFVLFLRPALPMSHTRSSRCALHAAC